ncbi:MAG: carboxypeptidase-like regulatory domain-containing protein, partial [Chitinophagaceae bacterium]
MKELNSQPKVLSIPRVLNPMTFKFIIALSFFSINAFAQTRQTQTIRGTVTELNIKYPLSGATITVETDQGKQAISDASGNFVIANVQLGRQKLLITYKGYKTVYLQNVDVDAGKELVLQIQMEEEVLSLKDITITALRNKSAPVNDLSLVSA